MDAPKIEVTDTNPSREPPPFPEFCEGVSDEWTDLRYHADGADYLVGQSPQHQDDVYASYAESRSPHRRSHSRRSDGGPGKSPSPSRTSPRRHSPVPYSPKRQHRTISPVTSDDLYDVTLSPRRHSPIPRLGEEARALSLTSDELICVSYSDPFASTPTTHTPEGVVAISVDCSHDMGSDQVEEVANNDLNNADMVSSLDGSAWLGPACVSPEDTCLQDTLVLLEEGNFQSPTEMLDSVPQDGDLFLYEVDEENPGSKNRDCDSSAEKGHFMAAKCSFPTSYYEAELMSHNFGEELYAAVDEADSPDWKLNNYVQDGLVPVLENQDNIADTAVVCTDSSSEDDMEETVTFLQPDDVLDLPSVPELDQIISVSQSHSDCMATTEVPQVSVSNTGATSQSALDSKAPVLPLCGEARSSASQDLELRDIEGVPLAEDLVKEPSFQYSSQDGFLQDLTADDLTWCFSEEDKILTSKRDSSHTSAVESKLLHGLEGEESGESTDLKILQHFSSEHHSSPCILPVDQTLSPLPSIQHPVECPSSLPASASLQTSPGNTSCQRISKTPEDFALCRLVGSPPLHFPHCRNVVLIHHALSSPYDPHLPTPPIVLTIDDSYDHIGLNPVHDGSSQLLNDDFDAFKEPVHVHINPVTFDQGSKEASGECQQRGDVSRSISCPDLSRTEFPKHEMGSVWGPSRHHHEDGMSVCGEEDGHCGFRNTSDSDGRCPVWTSSERHTDLAGCVTCFTVPASSSSSRAAVINRLRQVVERRISGSLDSLETSLHEG